MKARARSPGPTCCSASAPEALSLTGFATRDLTFERRDTDDNFMGAVIRIRMDIGSEVLSFDMFNSPTLDAPAIGQVASAHFSGSDGFEFAARQGPRSAQNARLRHDGKGQPAPATA